LLIASGRPGTFFTGIVFRRPEGQHGRCQRLEVWPRCPDPRQSTFGKPVALRRCRIVTTHIEVPRFVLQRFPDRSNRMLALAGVKTVVRFDLW